MDDHRWMSRAVELAGRCPPSESAFSVGAVIVDGHGTLLADGWSRDIDPHVHAEESALSRVTDRAALRTATVYSTLEPCSKRASRPHATCTGLIIAAGVPRVVIAWHEPDLFVTCEGVALLVAAGIEVVETPAFTLAARSPNKHLFRYEPGESPD
ncbi:deaminase [Actinoplanes sp. G11-F43]|uniref:deaminase n=1 Tax=Actinoplanes sp. G11-F43 TaxID=3424130 RepID=UPI003D33F4C5